MMERSAIMTTMGDLKLFGMRAAYDEIIKAAVKRSHEPQTIVATCCRPRSPRSRPARSDTR